MRAQCELRSGKHDILMKTYGFRDHRPRNTPLIREIRCNRGSKVVQLSDNEIQLKIIHRKINLPEIEKKEENEHFNYEITLKVQYASIECVVFPIKNRYRTKTKTKTKPFLRESNKLL